VHSSHCGAGVLCAWLRSLDTLRRVGFVEYVAAADEHQAAVEVYTDAERDHADAVLAHAGDALHAARACLDAARARFDAVQAALDAAQALAHTYENADLECVLSAEREKNAWLLAHGNGNGDVG
jgi:ABC-type transporter Mla subunit MlaD